MINRDDNQARFGRIIRTARWVELIGVVASATATVSLEQLLGGARALSLAETSGISVRSFPWVIGLCAAMALYTLFAETSGRKHLLMRSTLPGLALDFAFVTGVVAWTDGLQSLYYGLFYLIVIGVAMWYGREGALLAALVSTACLLIAEIIDLASPLVGGVPDLRAVVGAPEIYTRLPYLFLVAWLTGTVTEAFRRETDRRLEAERESSRLQADQARIAQELESARRVQESLLPSTVPRVPGLQIAVRYEPIGVVGGDLYDFPRLPDAGLGAVLADVSGHSLPAALLVAAAKGALYDALNLPPAQMMQRVNQSLLRDTGGDRFVTMVFARVDMERSALRWINAGHPAPILLRKDAEPAVLDGHGVVLGVLDGARYEEQAHTLRPGDVLLLYSDGLVERESIGGSVTAFGDFVESLRNVPVGSGVEEIAADVLQCAARLGHVRDDVALIVMKFSLSEEKTPAPCGPEKGRDGADRPANDA